MKSRRRNPAIYDFGTYMVVDPFTGVDVASAHPMGFGMTLAEVEAFLAED